MHGQRRSSLITDVENKTIRMIRGDQVTTLTPKNDDFWVNGICIGSIYFTNTQMTPFANWMEIAWLEWTAMGLQHLLCQRGTQAFSCIGIRHAWESVGLWIRYWRHGFRLILMSADELLEVLTRPFVFKSSTTFAWTFCRGPTNRPLYRVICDAIPNGRAMIICT